MAIRASRKIPRTGSVDSFRVPESIVSQSVAEHGRASVRFLPVRIRTLRGWPVTADHSGQENESVRHPRDLDVRGRVRQPKQSELEEERITRSGDGPPLGP